ncbi:CopD family protein [Snuella lapsa]|uniref:CopD family protein n=1 Tax=Snuella lapsa TaxID=870481 RepID=A0ABP6XBI9_9FLAO
MLLKFLIFIHIICATIWTGGHLILCLTILPKALAKNDFSIIESFETKYERIGLPALIILLLTGIYFTTVYTTNLLDLNFTDHYTRHILIKFLLLISTLLLALHARFVLIPKRALKPLSYHIILVTTLAVLFVFVGFSARSGGLL